MSTLSEALLYITVGVLSWIVFTTLRAIFSPANAVPGGYNAAMVGDITLEELSKYSGEDPFRPTLFAVRGRVFDVSEGRAFYGPGGPYAVFAGKEVARALGKMSTDAADCTGEVGDLSEKELGVLADWEAKFEKKYKVVGQVAPLKDFSPAQLATHDGGDPDGKILLSVRGTVFDVTSGRDFYGRDAAYPFGGRECARALAKFSTEIEDCCADLEGCTLSEMDALRDWEARFHSKYPVVGRLVAAKTI